MPDLNLTTARLAIDHVLILQSLNDAVIVVDPELRIQFWNPVAEQIYGWSAAEALGQPIGAILLAQQPQAGESPELTFSAIREHLPWRGELNQLHRDGRALVIEAATQLLLDSQGQALGLVTINRDITLRRQAERQNEALLDTLKRNLAEAALIRQIAQSAAGEADLSQILTNALGQLTRVIDFTGGSIALVEGDELVIRAAIGPMTEIALGQRLRRGAGLSWRVVDMGLSFVCNDLAAVGATSASAAMRSYLAVPLMWRDHIYGMLEVDSTAPNAFASPDLNLMEAVALVLSGPIELARRYATEQEAEQALRQKSLEQEVLLDTIPALVYYKNRSSTYLAVNRRFADVVNRPIDEIVGATDVDLFPPEEAAIFRADDLEVMESGQPKTDIEAPMTMPDGQIRWSITSKTPYRNQDGEVLGMVGITIDSTKRKRAETSLQFLLDSMGVLSSSLDYETTINNVAHLAVPALADWCIVDIINASDVVERVVVAHADPAQADLAEHLRAYPSTFRDNDGMASVLRDGVALLLSEISDKFFEVVAQDEEHLALLRTSGIQSLVIVPLLARGRTFGALLFGSCQPGRRYDADDLAMIEELGRRAGLAVDNARLFQNAQDALHVRDQFISIAAHELKTPITGILGNAQLLERRIERDGILRARDLRSFETLIQQVRRLNRLSVALLDLSRLQYGMLHLDRGPVDLAALVSRVAEEMQPALSQHSLTCDVPQQPVMVDGDDLRLEQVIQNLLQNAIKYSPAGGPIRIELAAEADAARLSVIDLGIGIPAAALPEIFNRFYRAENINLSRVGGMGLGLYLVQEIVTHHGGQIEVASVEGQGSTFTVRLPLLGPESQPPAP